MFISAVLAFATGIYLQAVRPFPLGWLLLAGLTALLLIPLFLRKRRGAALLLLLFCFMLVGGIRLAFLTREDVRVPAEGGELVVEGSVLEASSRIKVIELSNPAHMRGIRVVFLSDLPLEISQKVTLFGSIRELNPSFKNPGLSSWKWVKRLEGVSYEVRGKLLSVTPGSSRIGALRNLFKRNIETSGAKHVDILKALTIGDRTALDEETNKLFLRTGTSHVLAISGFNVGIISAFFFFLLRTLLRRVRRLRLSGRDVRYASLLTIPFPFIFMLVAGAGVSLIRATIMIAVYMLALFFERGRNVLNTMAFSALVILLIYPHSLFTPSLQLTFLSLLFIVLFMGKLHPLIKKIRIRALGWSISTILTTVAATLGTAPIVIYYFFGLNPFCVIHNLVTVPLIGVFATALSLIGMAIPKGQYLLMLAGELTGLNLRLLKTLDFGYIYPIIRPDFFEILLYYSLILALLYARLKPVLAALLVIVLPLSFGQIYVDYQKRFNRNLCISFIDVGMGDSMLIEAPGGKRLLVDGGGYYGIDFDIGRQVLTPFLLSKKILTLECVVLTHPHTDHLGGLSAILKDFNVRAFITSPPPFHDGKLAEMMRLAREKGIRRATWRGGDTYGLDNGLLISVLHPGSATLLENPNNDSLVLKIDYGRHTFLLTGDIERDVEEALLLAGTNVRASVLKIPHHGSNTSSSLSFIQAVKPDVAVLSAARGIKGLPAEDALNRYRMLSVPVLRTDRDGLVEICSDGKRLTYDVFQQ